MRKGIRTLGKRDKFDITIAVIHYGWGWGQGVFNNSLNRRKTTAMAVLFSVGLGKKQDLQSPV